MDFNAAAPIIIALVAVVPGMYLMNAQRRRATAEADRAYIDAAEKLIKPLSDRIDSLEASNRSLKLSNDDLTDQLRQCMSKLTEALAAMRGGEPDCPAT